jgi:hypothetical protein
MVDDHEYREAEMTGGQQLRCWIKYGVGDNGTRGVLLATCPARMNCDVTGPRRRRRANAILEPFMNAKIIYGTAWYAVYALLY